MNLAVNYGPIATFLLAWAAKATVLLATAWIAALALRRYSAALRHRIWAIAIVSSLALPLVSFAAPAWHVISRPAVTMQTISQTTPVVAPPALPAQAAQANRGIDIETLIAAGLLIWALGTMLVVSKLLIGLMRLWRMSSYSTMAPENACATLSGLRELFRIKRRVRLLESASSTMMPMTWGVFRPRVLLPSGAANWDADRQRIVLSHELAHVLRNDWLLQFCAEVLRACFWFHPLAWIAARRLRQESERACDDAVLNSGITAPEYASQLLALAKTLKTPNWRFSLALAVARPSNLERRFAAMLNSSIPRTPLSRTSNFLAISLGACLLLPLAALTLSAEPSRETVQDPSTTPLASSPARDSTAIAGASIVGRLIDQKGSAIQGANVTAISGETSDNTSTDVEGRFLFSELAPGAWRLHVERRQLGVAQSRTVDVWVPNRTTTRNIDIVLSGAQGSFAGSLASSSSTANVALAATKPQSAPSGPAASISGSVGDPSGAVIPRANVTLTDVATGQQQQIATDPVGEFSFSNLIPDGYELSIAQPGFQIFKETIQLSPSEQVKLPELLLRVGDVSQTIEITASRTAPARAQMTAASAVPVLACSAQTTQAVQPASRSPFQGAAPGPIRVKVGGMVEAARLIQQQDVPIYPESARASGVQGTVVFNTVIGKDGSLLSPCVVNSKVDPALVQSALAAISQWRYSPALLNGEPIEVVTQIAAVYSLTNQAPQ